MKAPGFWDRDGVVPRLLEPMSRVFQAGGAVRRRLGTTTSVGPPVICVGNLIAGGAGKTPVALAIGIGLVADGYQVGFLSRGHGGCLAGPVQVDPAVHGAGDVGDEALLLAEVAPTWISRDWARGGLAARRAGAEIIVMDDGFQNPDLEKTLSLVVVDGAYGFGNGRVIPAGPLREPVADGLARADAVVLIGADTAGIGSALPPGLPVLRASIMPAVDSALPTGTTVFGFAGIGRPEKFRASLEALGLKIAGFQGFADHHRYTETEVAALRDRAAGLNAVPVTTAKDHVRLRHADRMGVRRIDIALLWRDAGALDQLLKKALGHAKA